MGKFFLIDEITLLEDFIDNATLEQIAKKVDERIDAIRMEYVDDELKKANHWATIGIGKENYYLN